MLLRTVGHATLSLEPKGHADPLLITDPWLIGSCYWRSWWLERYPSAQQIARLADARYCYLTHEHPDHFHPPSLRRLGRGPEFLVPEFTRDMMGNYLRENGFRARTLPAGGAVELEDGHGVRVVSMPALGNDSALVIATERALIANLNDARPLPDQLLALRRVRRALGRGKPCILLASYSSAGISHALFKRGRRVEITGKRRHLDYVALLCRALDAQIYVPFASQVSFERPDTTWANAHRTRIDDVYAQLANKVQVLPPYVTLDLDSGAHTTEHGTPPQREPRIAERVQAQLERERSARLVPAEIDQLARKLRAGGHALLPLLFPRGIQFELGAQPLYYNVLTGRIDERAAPASAVFALPAQAVRDVLHSGYFSDLFIPMFMRVELAPETPPLAVYAFAMLMQLHDVGATSSVREFGRWLKLLTLERARMARPRAQYTAPAVL